MNLEGIDFSAPRHCGLDPQSPIASELADEWIISEFEIMSAKVSKFYNSYDIDSAARELYDFLWTKFCDWYIELSKIRIMSEDLSVKKQVLSILIHILKGTLQLLSPIMPFITSEIWEILDKNAEIISNTIIEPVKNAAAKSPAIEKMKIIQDIITKLRTLRSEMNISPAMQIEALFNVLDEGKKDIAKENEGYIKQLAKLSKADFAKNIARPKNSALIVSSGFEIFVPLEGLIDIDKEKKRLSKEIENAQAEIARTASKLENQNFIKRAPAQEVEKIKARLNEAKQKIETINGNLKFLQ
jgi:valyl-tRNA synthetase